MNYEKKRKKRELTWGSPHSHQVCEFCGDSITSYDGRRLHPATTEYRHIKLRDCIAYLRNTIERLAEKVYPDRDH